MFRQYDIHQNDREEQAKRLFLPLPEFDRLVVSANRAYRFLKTMGPFYGKEDVAEPTFRITAEPVRLPLGSKKILTLLGDDLLHLGRALPKLPYVYKMMMGNNLDFRVPLTWRIDCILDNDGNIKVNEIEGKDGASALMVVEQLAYSLQSLEETTIGRFIEALKKIYLVSGNMSTIRIAIIRTDIATDQYALNTYRFIEMVHELSKGLIQCDLYDTNDLKGALIKQNWKVYDAVFNETFLSPQQLQELGIPVQNLLAAGNYDALVNKGVFALVHELALQQFWEKEIGRERLGRLQALLIPSRFITTAEELSFARMQGKVVKVTWAEGNMIVVNRSKGVAMPVGEINQSSNERWEFLYNCLKLGYTIKMQDFVEPAKIYAYLRKRGTTLEAVDWYNRVCVKYVVDGNPNGVVMPPVHMTAVEVTLGPEVIPASRECAFTAGTFT